MKSLTIMILVLLMITACTNNKKTNNRDQSTFEPPFNQFTIGMEKDAVLKMCKKPYHIELDKIYNGEKQDHYWFDRKPKETVFKIIFKENKVIKVLRFDGSISADGKVHL